jgi:hypothetical protein
MPQRTHQRRLIHVHVTRHEAALGLRAAAQAHEGGVDGDGPGAVLDPVGTHGAEFEGIEQFGHAHVDRDRQVADLRIAVDRRTHAIDDQRVPPVPLGGSRVAATEAEQEHRDDGPWLQALHRRSPSQHGWRRPPCVMDPLGVPQLQRRRLLRYDPATNNLRSNEHDPH